MSPAIMTQLSVLRNTLDAGRAINDYDRSAEAHFLSSKASRAQYSRRHKRAVTPLGKKWARPFGLYLKKRHASLHPKGTWFEAHLEQPNYSPLASLGVFSGTTVQS